MFPDFCFDKPDLFAHLKVSELAFANHRSDGFRVDTPALGQRAYCKELRIHCESPQFLRPAAPGEDNGEASLWMSGRPTSARSSGHHGLCLPGLVLGAHHPLQKLDRLDRPFDDLRADFFVLGTRVTLSD